MSQQINLYQPELFEQKVPFPATALMTLLAAGLVLLLAVGAVGAWRVFRLEKRLVQLQGQRDAATARINDYQLRYPPLKADPLLTEQVTRLRKDRQARLTLLQSLTGDRPGNSRGFSGHLAGLAKEDLASIWLRRIRFSSGGRQLVLEGSTTRAADVPLFLQGLAGQAVFAGREFEHLQLDHAEATSPVIDFLLHSVREEKP